MSLREAIESVRQDGIDISYSSKLVKPWMRVRETPSAADPLQCLQEVLAHYGLELKPGPQHHWLIVQGDVVEQVTEPVAETARQVIRTRPEPIEQLDEVVIVASRYELFAQGLVNGQFLTGEEISLLPHIADDVFRAFHRVPGAAATDFSAPFNLRGGAVNETMVTLDGLEILEPYHMRTLFSPLSIIDPGIVGNAAVLSGGFAAEYGNHASGVIEISSKWTHGEPVHQLGVSFVSAFARSSGSWGERGNYLVSARRGYLDLLADAVAVGDEDVTPRYGDVFAKVGYALSDSTQIDAHLLSASDDVSYKNASESEQGDGEGTLLYSWLTLDSELDDHIRWINTLSTGQVETEDSGHLRNWPQEYMERFFRRDFRTSGIQSELNLQLTHSQFWAAGIRYRRLEADFDYKIDSFRQFEYINGGLPLALRRNIMTSREGSEYGTYLRFRHQTKGRWTWEAGLRWDKQTYTDTADDTQLSPRVMALFEAGERTDLRLGWGYFHQPQGIQELQVEDGVTDYHPAELAEHFVAGLHHQFSSDIELQLDIYRKDYSDLIPRYENVLDSFEYAPESDFDRVLVEPSSAEAKGVEITLRNRQGQSLDWWINYTWSRAEDVVDEVVVPRSWDQRHALTGNLIWRGQQWVLSLAGRYHSGWPRTPLLVTVIPDEANALIGVDGDLSQRNQERYDDYFRLDLRLSRTVQLDRGSLQFYFEVFNLLNTDNQCCVAGHDLTASPSPVLSPQYDSYLPIFPSFGFIWTFDAGS